jgi:hypothetical protein
MQKEYINPTVECYTMQLQDVVAASDPNKPVVAIDETADVDFSTKSRQQNVWDEEDGEMETDDV